MERKHFHLHPRMEGLDLKMNLHVIPETIDELKGANPVFLHELFTHGKVLYAKFPLEVFPKPVGLDTFCLVLYEMGGLSYRDKMKVSYSLYGGAVEEPSAKREESSSARVAS